MEIKNDVQQFDRLNRDVELLSKVLLFFIALLSARIIFLIYEQKFSDIWAVLPPMTALVSALLVARVATRLTTHNIILRKDDIRQDMVRVTHHLIAIVQDLEGRITYIKRLLSTGNRPVLVFRELSITIEHRYETLLERDVYRYLPGDVVDIIVKMSGSIFGLCTFAVLLEKATNNQAMIPIEKVFPGEIEKQVDSVNKLLVEIAKLIERLFEVRSTIDS